MAALQSFSVVCALLAMAASRERRAGIIEEIEADEEVTLDASHERGLRKIQVSAWLLFEDSTSSMSAKVVQGVLILLIVISTINMLVESHTSCRFEPNSEPPAANAGLGTSHYQRTCDEVTWSPQQTKQFEAVEMVHIAAACTLSTALALALTPILTLTRRASPPSRSSSSCACSPRLRP